MNEFKKIKPVLSKGTRDFLPSEVAKRNYIFEIIKSVFRKYGFEQIETPAIERLETLTGKYGEEGDKLLFKILNSGNFLQGVADDKMDLKNMDVREVTRLISEKGLRYDLTVPLARYVVQHQDHLAFPFKRFHVGPVWRADRPQKGRYQEFYQFDADVIGSNSLLNEVELTAIFLEVFACLGIEATVRINNRKILEAITEYADCKNEITAITTAIDKMDKIGIVGVKTEFQNLNLNGEQVDKIVQILQIKSLTELTPLFENIAVGLQGIAELQFVVESVSSNHVVFDITLARGLNYYTGIIWEVNLQGGNIGSISSGGRYDNLTEIFGGQNMSGVGISFGIERIYDVMEEKSLFPDTIAQGVKVLFVAREQAAEIFAYQRVKYLRENQIPAELFLGNVKKQKQYTYVEQKNISFIVEVGSDEVKSQKFKLRNVHTRETQIDLSIEQIAHALSNPK